MNANEGNKQKKKKEKKNKVEIQTRSSGDQNPLHNVKNVNLCFIFIIGLVSRVFANGPGDQGSIPGRVIPKTLKIELDTSLLNTQQYKVCIKGKVGGARGVMVIVAGCGHDDTSSNPGRA